MTSQTSIAPVASPDLFLFEPKIQSCCCGESKEHIHVIISLRSRGRAYRQTNKQTNRQTNRQTDKQTDRQTDRQTVQQSNKQTEKEIIFGAAKSEFRFAHQQQCEFTHIADFLAVSLGLFIFK